MRASLKIVSFTIYEIQHNSQFLTNKMLFSSPIQSLEASMTYSKPFRDWRAGLVYHDVHEKKSI